MRTIIILFVLIASLIFFAIITLRYYHPSKATVVKSNLIIDTKKVLGPVFPNWKAIAQGGEESGVRMFQNVLPQMTELQSRYIRLDHLYDFYDVVSQDGGSLRFTWDSLDATICDILSTGAKPFLALTYMPTVISDNGTVIGRPKDWTDWSIIVQMTIERYSGKTSQLCGGKFTGVPDIYYEVWNEPDLETFGKWSKGEYFKLYNYASQGANRAQDVYPFMLGGPAITSLYENWIKSFINYVDNNNLKLDFISWHRYTTNPDDYTKDLTDLESWLASLPLKYRNITKVISEWSYDSSHNPKSDIDGSGAYTVASIRNLMNKGLELAFSFEVKDGPTPSWGILSYTGEKKPRFYALRILNLLKGLQLQVDGEGTFVRAIASFNPVDNKISVVLVNYDPNNSNNELVPLTFANIADGNYQMILTYTNNQTVTFNDLVAAGGRLQRSILMNPNMVIGVELQKL